MLSIKLMFNKKDIYQTKYINIQNYFTIIFADDIDINIWKIYYLETLINRTIKVVEFNIWKTQKQKSRLKKKNIMLTCYTNKKIK